MPRIPLQPSLIRCRRGGFRLHVILVAATLVLVGAVVVFIARSRLRDQQMHRRVALRICEDGLITALEQLQNNPSWRTGIPRTSFRDGWYEVVVKEVRDSVAKLSVTAIGESGGVQRQQQSVLEIVVDNGDTVWRQATLLER